MWLRYGFYMALPTNSVRRRRHISPARSWKSIRACVLTWMIFQRSHKLYVKNRGTVTMYHIWVSQQVWHPGFVKKKGRRRTPSCMPLRNSILPPQKTSDNASLQPLLVPDGYTSQIFHALQNNPSRLCLTPPRHSRRTRNEVSSKTGRRDPSHTDKVGWRIML